MCTCTSENPITKIVPYHLFFTNLMAIIGWQCYFSVFSIYIEQCASFDREWGVKCLVIGGCNVYPPLQFIVVTRWQEGLQANWEKLVEQLLVILVKIIQLVQY